MCSYPPPSIFTYDVFPLPSLLPCPAPSIFTCDVGSCLHKVTHLYHYKVSVE